MMPVMRFDCKPRFDCIQVYVGGREMLTQDRVLIVLTLRSRLKIDINDELTLIHSRSALV